MDELIIKPVARIHTDFSEKFGIPRQAGIVEELEGLVVFEPDFRSEEALRGIEGFSHLWLVWGFSANYGRNWSPTVRPPRLGGNTRVGVFASRSPFRPNPLGLSCVKLLAVEKTRDRGSALRVAGADMMDGTPIYDIKPYLPYADAIEGAIGGFAPAKEAGLEVILPEELERLVPAGKREGLKAVLAQDPRPRYQEAPERVYGMSYAGMEIRFRVEEKRLTVVAIEKKESRPGRPEC